MEWRGLIQRGAAERLVAMDDAALAVRLARMALDDGALVDIHAGARATLAEHGMEFASAVASRKGSSRLNTVKLRRPKRS